MRTTSAFQPKLYMRPGVISRGLRGAEPPCKHLCSFWGLSPPNVCINLAFQSTFALLPIFCMVLLWWTSSLLCGSWNLCRCWLYHIIIRLNYYVSIFNNMGVAANGLHPLSDIGPRAPLVKIFRNHPCLRRSITLDNSELDQTSLNNK